MRLDFAFRNPLRELVYLEPRDLNLIRNRRTQVAHGN